MATTIGSGAYSEHIVSPTGVRHHFWVSGGAIKRESIDSLGNTVIAESSVVASGVDSDALAAAMGPTNDTIYLQYRSSGSIVVAVSTDGGATFA